MSQILLDDSQVPGSTQTNRHVFFVGAEYDFSNGDDAIRYRRTGYNKYDTGDQALNRWVCG